MADSHLHALLADSILVCHFLFVLTVVFGLALILIGKSFGWHWITHPWFRLFHLLAIVFVVVQSWMGKQCPLTIWEMDLLRLANEAAYTESFIQYWVSRLLYYEAPMWVFTVVYTLFAGLVLLSWFWVRPRPFKKFRFNQTAKTDPPIKLDKKS